MEKRMHKYRLTLEYLEDVQGNTVSAKPIELTFENHDNIISIIEKMQAKDPFDNRNHVAELAIGIKLFSEVMIKNRKHPLFDELAPAFNEFMKKLKTLPAKNFENETSP